MANDMPRRPDPPLFAPPLDYVPTAPVHKPRRAVRRAVRAGLCAAAALTAGFFAPFMMLAGVAIVVAWLTFCRLFYWWQYGD